MLLWVQSFLLPCSAAALVGLPAGAPSRNIAMCAQDVRHLYVPDVVLDKETVAAAKVELLTDEEDWEPLEQPEAVDVGLDMQLSQQPTRAGDRDASVVQYREASSFFESLLHQREASRPAGSAATPVETTLQDKVRQLSFLQSELEYVISSGLASEARETWLEEKAALEALKRNVKLEWVRAPPTSPMMKRPSALGPRTGGRSPLAPVAAQMLGAHATNCPGHCACVRVAGGAQGAAAEDRGCL